MKKTLRHAWLLATLALLLGAATAIAQNPPEPPTPPRNPDAALEDAQARLEQAAREIAELTARMVGEAGVTALAHLGEAGRRARPAMLGINIGLVGGPEAREEGVQVLGVTPGSAAEEAGIRSGDVLLAIDATRLDWSSDTTPVSKLLEALREIEPGTEVSVTYRRDGRTATAAVEARPWSLRGGFPFDAERFAQSLPSREHFTARRFMVKGWGDMELVTLTPGLGEYFQVDDGVLVVRAPTDPALGLRDGDVIVDIAGRKPADPGHVVRILRSYAPGERLVMTIVRKGRRQQLEADIPG